MKNYLIIIHIVLPLDKFYGSSLKVLFLILCLICRFWWAKRDKLIKIDANLRNENSYQFIDYLGFHSPSFFSFSSTFLFSGFVVYARWFFWSRYVSVIQFRFFFHVFYLGLFCSRRYLKGNPEDEEIMSHYVKSGDFHFLFYLFPLLFNSSVLATHLLHSWSS